jgi:7-keto-8-aminopelargonate synthetase-like enzyme
MQSLYTHTTPTTTVNINGKELTFFSGFAYLGLHAHPVFKEALKEGIDKYGTIFISSRIANVRLTLYDELEHTLAIASHQPAAVTFSSGYMASQAAIQYVSKKYEVIYAPNTHPALQTDNPIIPKMNWRDWADQTIKLINTNNNKYVIVADSVNPLTSTINDFSWLTELKQNTLILIDDSHGIGILGATGNGIIHTLPKQPHLDYLISASLAKAYSIQGGVITGSGHHIEQIKKQPIFTAGTPLMPANAYAFLNSTKLHSTQRALLHLQIAHFKIITKDIETIHNPHLLPVFLLNSPEEQYLLDNDIVISSFGYPNPDSPAINRIIITAGHTTAQLDHLHKLLKTTQHK